MVEFSNKVRGPGQPTPLAQQPSASGSPATPVYEPDGLEDVFGARSPQFSDDVPPPSDAQAPPPKPPVARPRLGGARPKPAVPATVAEAAAAVPQASAEFNKALAQDRLDLAAANRAKRIEAEAAVPTPAFDPGKFKFLPDILRERGQATVPPLEEVTMVLFGTPGTGKTWLTAGRPASFVIATEPGAQFLDVPVSEVRSWVYFQNIIDDLTRAKQTGGLPYRSIAIDIVDNLAGYCLDAVCAAKPVPCEYPPENDFGKTWKQIRLQWETWMRLLMDTVNVTYLTHCTTEKRTIKGRVGDIEVDVIVPTFKGNKQAQYLDGIVHAMGYVHKNQANRYVVSFRNEATIAAKDRTGILAALGEIDITAETPAGAWEALALAYEQRATELGYTIKSKWGQP